MSDVPTDLHRDILTRVPVKSLARFRAVSKAWCHTIDDPDFVKLHIGRQGDGDLLIIRNQTGKLFSLSLNSLLNFSELCTETIKATSVKNLILRDVPRVHEMPVLSCHGLVLISSVGIHNLWTLWNPTTGDYLKLPSCTNFTNITYYARSGFGYVSATKDYKVVRVGQFYNPRSLETLIYSVNTGKWNKLDDFVNHSLQPHAHGASLNGVLHWIGYERPGFQEEKIIALDLATESYDKLPMPSAIFKTESHPNNMRLDVLSECLLLSCCYMGGGFDVWRMNKCKGEDMWTMLFTLNQSPTILYTTLNLRLLAYFRSSALFVIQCNGRKILCFDGKKKVAKKIQIEGIEGEVTCQVFQSSIVRFNGTGSKNNACECVALEGARKRKRSRASDRLELQITTRSVAGQESP